jgi:hypothetical protein
MGRSCSEAWKAPVSLMLRAVAATLGTRDLRVRVRPDVVFVPVWARGPLLGGLSAELFFFVFFLTVAEAAAGAPEAPAASRAAPGKEMQINTAASRKRVLPRFILCSETAPSR